MDDHRRQGLSRHRFKRGPASGGGWLGWILSLLALFFVGRWLWRVDHSVWLLFRTFHWGPAILSLIILQGWFLLRYWGWSLISRRFGVVDEHVSNIKMWTLSELLRYIPGNVWSFAARFRGARERGAGRGGAATALVLEALCLVSGAALVSGWFWKPEWWSVWLTGMVIVIFTLPLMLNFIIRWRRWESTAKLSAGQSIGLVWLYSVLWLVYGFGQSVIMRALPGIALPSISVLIGVNVLAWLVGYLSIVTPMGLGVREVVFVGLLRSTVVAAVASILAVLTRVWLIISEIIFLALVMIISSRQLKKR